MAGILYCSFCGKSQDQVRKLVAGPTVFICNECVEICVDVITDDARGADVDFLKATRRAVEGDQDAGV